MSRQDTTFDLEQLLSVAPNGRHNYSMSRNDMRDVLATALRAGQLMVENGANTARVEETVHRLATALGAEWCDVYVTPTGIIATVYHHGEHRTRIQRIVRAGVDLSRVSGVLEVSRAAAELTPQQARERLEQVATRPRLYGRWLTTAAVGVACACLSTLFGGGMLEWLVTFVASALAFLARDWMHYYNLSRPLMSGIAAFVAAGVAYGLSLLLGAPFAAQAISASVLFLVPGVPLISAMVDLFRGDTVSGMARLASAILLIVAISAGVWAMLLGTQAQMNLDPGRLDTLLLAVPLAFLSSCGFAIMFDVPYRALLVAALVGAIGYTVFRLAGRAALPTGAAAFLAGMAISALAELLARPFRLPTSIFTIPGFLPLVPGAAAFRTLLHFAGDDYTGGIEGLVRTTIIVVALAAGIGTISALARLGRKPVV